MKTKTRQVLWCATLFLLWINQSGQAQTIYRINDSKENEMRLAGTSTLHDWVMNTSTLSCEAQFKTQLNGLKSISALTFSLPVENLKSDEKALNHNAYKALKSEEFKNIVFKLTSALVGERKNSKEPVKAVGDLTIAGVTKEINLDVFCQLNKDQTITCTGNKKLNMTDYDVEPPTFLFGAMKTGDEITLDFNLTFKK